MELDFNISSGPFSVRIETNSQRFDKDNVPDQDLSLTIRELTRFTCIKYFGDCWLLVVIFVYM